MLFQIRKCTGEINTIIYYINSLASAKIRDIKPAGFLSAKTTLHLPTYISIRGRNEIFWGAFKDTNFFSNQSSIISVTYEKELWSKMGSCRTNSMINHF